MHSLSASVMRSVNGSTEFDVNTAVAATLKYAPERSGGGGRTASTTILNNPPILPSQTHIVV